jgi:drug/metabolite transporter (DMT)-like permease
MPLANNAFHLGLFFITIAILAWGILPIALKLSSPFIDPVTFTWFRYIVAFLISFALQYWAGKLGEFKSLVRADWIQLSLAAVFSIANYVSFVYCLNYLTPGQSQLNFQTAPFLLAFGGVLFFKEKLQPVQMACFATLALGMLLFFHPHLDFSQQKDNGMWLGVMIVQFSAISWVCYSLLQKSLMGKLSAPNFLLYVYGFASVVMLPFCQYDAFAPMNTEQWLICLFSAVATLVAFGCFAQSMKYWPASQVGPMIAITPVCSFATTRLVSDMNWWPGIIISDQLDLQAIAGIVIVVLSVVAFQLLPMWMAKRAKNQSTS